MAFIKKILLVAVCLTWLCGCSLLKGNEKTGCPTNGKNIGAERILSGDKSAIKSAKKAKKFKYDH